VHIPKKFRQEDLSTLKKFIVEAPFAALITNSKKGLDATHLPFILEEAEGKTFLQGHVAKANPLWQNVDDQAEVLVVFNGPNCYVSPNYYPTKKEHGKAVPTWNYVCVHVRGVVSFIDDDDWNLQMLNTLTTVHEASQKKPWSVADAPREHIQKMLSAIVGIEINVSSIIGQWKLSQNQPVQNQQGVIEGLSREANGLSQECVVSNSQKIAELVQDYMLKS
jgi:transcriptional regulator